MTQTTGTAIKRFKISEKFCSFSSAHYYIKYTCMQSYTVECRFDEILKIIWEIYCTRSSGEEIKCKYLRSWRGTFQCCSCMSQKSVKFNTHIMDICSEQMFSIKIVRLSIKNNFVEKYHRMKFDPNWHFKSPIWVPYADCCPNPLDHDNGHKHSDKN